MSLVWIDLETTGLQADKESVLEVACIVTDDALNALGSFQRVIYYNVAQYIVEAFEQEHARATAGKVAPAERPEAEQRVGNHIRHFRDADINPYVLQMHDVNGLWKDCQYGQALATVDRDLAAFIRETAVRQIPKTDPQTGAVTMIDDLPQLAGSTISFDRAFLGQHLKKTIAQLHYRNVDVTTLNETAKRFWPPVYEARPRSSNKAHRGMADIIESIAQYTHYLSSLAPAGAAKAAILEYDAKHAQNSDCKVVCEPDGGVTLQLINYGETEPICPDNLWDLTSREARVLAARLLKAADEYDALETKAAA